VTETVSGVTHSFRLTRDAAQMGLWYTSDATGAPKGLRIVKSPDPPPPSMQPKDLARTDTILGETCRWFDMTPGMMDAGQLACLTSDGVLLKEENWARSTVQTWTAVRVTRRPVSLDEIKPPAALLEPSLWGIE
jgi:hypothetical protein